MAWGNWLYAKTDTTGKLHLLRLAKLLLEFLTLEKGQEKKVVAEALLKDYQRGNRPDIPAFLKGSFGASPPAAPAGNAPVSGKRLPRQSRHQPGTHG
jgi:hypothetical protein